MAASSSTDFGGGIDTDLLDEQAPMPAEHAERLYLTAGTVEGEHQHPDRTFTQRVHVRQLGELAEHRPMTPRARSASSRDSTANMRSSSRGPPPFRDEKREIGQVGQDIAAPEGESGGVAALVHQPLEPARVHPLRLDVERIAATDRAQRLRRQHPAQFGDVLLQNLGCRRRWTSVPHVLDQQVGSDGTCRGEEQAGEDCSLAWPAQSHRLAGDEHLQRPEDAELDHDSSAGRVTDVMPPGGALPRSRDSSVSHPLRTVAPMVDRPPRRGSLPVRVELGLAAFAPALGLLAFRTWGSRLAWLFLVPAVFGVLVLVYGAVLVARGNAERFVFTDIDDLSSEILGHVGAYLLPVLVNTSSSTEEVAISVIIMGLIVLIHVSTGRVHVNPLLYLVGLRVYQATTNGTAFYLIARSDVSDWTGRQPCVQLGANALVEKRPRRARRR